MRILVVSSGLRPEHFGGLPSHVEDLLGALSGAGEEVAYLNVGSKSKWPFTQVSKKHGLAWPAWNLSTHRSYARYWLGSVQPWAQVRLDNAFRKAFLRVIDEFRPQIVHFHELTSVPIQIFEVLAAKKIKLVYSAHDFYSLCPTVKLLRPDNTVCERDATSLDCQNCCTEAVPDRLQQWGYANDQLFAGNITLRNIGRRLIRGVEKISRRIPESQAYRQRRLDFIRLMSCADAVLVTSKAQETIFRLHTETQWKLRYLPLARLTIRPDRPKARKETVKSDVIRFIALNIVNKAKGADLLRSTFTTLAGENRGVELRLYGLSPKKEAAITSFGPYDDGQLDRILAEADFGILPSIWPEAFGYVGPEMLSRGIPVIASRMGAMPDYVIDGVNGLLFDPNLEGDLVDKIRAVLADSSLRERLWAGAASGERHYLTMGQHVSALREIYANLVDGTREQSKIT